MGNFGKLYDFSDEIDIYNNLFKENYDSFKKVLNLPVNVFDDILIEKYLVYLLNDLLFRYEKKFGKKIDVLKYEKFNSYFLKLVCEKNNYNLNQVDKLKSDTYTLLSDILKKMGIYFNQNYESNIDGIFLSYKFRSLIEILYKKGVLKNDNMITYWNINYKVMIDKNDIEFRKEIQTKYYIRYFVDTKKDLLIVGTFCPYTIFADVALAVNPMDKRYKKYIGKKVIIPIINQPIPIIVDDRVDMTEDYGVVRVTPGHDEFGLQLAQEHGLDLYKYAINTDGKFTKNAGVFAGKEKNVFEDNIIKFLDDISNLDSKVKQEIEVFYCNKTGVRLEKFLKEQWLVDVPEIVIEDIIEKIDFEKFKVLNYDKEKIKDIVNDNKNWNMVKENGADGKRIIVYNKKDGFEFLDINKIIDYYVKSKSKKGIFVTVLIFELIVNGYLSSNFTINEFVDIIMKNSWQSNNKIIDDYIEFFEKIVNQKFINSEIKEFKKLLDFEKKDSETKFSKIVDYLDNSLGINDTNGKYYIDYTKIIDNQDVKGNIHEFVLDDGFLSSLYLVYTKKYVSNDFYSFVQITESELNLFVRSCIFALIYDKNIGFEEFFVVFEQNNGLEYKKDDINAFLDMYGADSFRLFLLSSYKNQDIQSLDYYNGIINKLWNIGRFIKKMSDDKGFDDFELKKLEKVISDNNQDLTEYDVWILYYIQDMIEDCNDYIKNSEFDNYINKIIYCIEKYFGNWYISISKNNNSQWTIYVFLYVFGKILQYVHVVIPFVVEVLWKKIGYKNSLDVYQDIELSLPSKNYKLKLFIDIIGKLDYLKSDLGLKKHEKVCVFVKGNPDLLDFVSQNQNIFEELLNIKEIKYQKLHDDDLEGYHTDRILDVLVGLKNIEVKTKKDIMIELEYLLSEKRHLLQHIRGILSNMDLSVNSDVVIKKEQEMDILKEEISQIEYKINKLKNG